MNVEHKKNTSLLIISKSNFSQSLYLFVMDPTKNEQSQENPLQTGHMADQFLPMKNPPNFFCWANEPIPM